MSEKLSDDLKPVKDSTVGKAQGLEAGVENVSGERSRYTYDGSTAISYALATHAATDQAPAALRTAHGKAGDTFDSFNDEVAQYELSNPCQCPDCTKYKAVAHVSRDDESRRNLLTKGGGRRYPVQFEGSGYDGI